MIRSLVTFAFGARGLRCDAARDGREGVEMLERAQYRVLLLDLMMPVMSGYSVLEAIVSNRSVQRPDVIFIASAASEIDIDRPEMKIVHAIVRKPFAIDSLVQLVVDVLAVLGPVP